MWTIAICLILGAMQGDSATNRAEVERIDTQIEDLKEKQRGFEGKALRAEDQAERMQFEDRNILEARQYFRIAEEYRQKAKSAEDEIDRLEKRKAKLLGP